MAYNRAKGAAMSSFPPDLAALTAPLFRVLPIERAMTRPVVTAPLGGEAAAAVKDLLKSPAIGEKSALAAGLWLYVDDLNASHVISQAHEGDATFDYWHCIMHRLEGDFSNSHYWLRRVGKHAAMAGAPAGYDAGKLIDAAQAAEKSGAASAGFQAMQRGEWATLMAWCWANKK
jgi:hypothetical protein